MGCVRVALTVGMAAAPMAHADWTAIPLGQSGESRSEVYAVSAGMQGGAYTPHLGQAQAGFWTGSADSWTPLFVSQTTIGEVYAIDGQAQAGEAAGRAAVWQGTPDSRVDLGPAGIISYAYAMRGNIQAGEIIPASFSHAAMWQGTAASMVDLNPTGARQSFAYATDGVLEGGVVYTPDGIPHAALWSGTAASYIDLNPGRVAYIYGMAPGVQVGYAQTANQHAAMWSGTAGSYVDLNPFGSQGGSVLYATTGTISVGDFGLVGDAHAGICFNTPGSWTDLHQFLPTGFTQFSHASSVYQDGNTIYVGGWATNDATGKPEAILWVGTVPAPGSAAVLLSAGIFAARRRRED